VNELGVILKETGLCDVIGLQAYTPGILGVESTDHEKRVSTTESYPEAEGEERLANKKNVVIASFAFF
jgi:hypothetical protein